MHLYDMDALQAGWVAGESVASLAGRLGVGMTTIRNLATSGKLPWREPQNDQEPDAPSAEDAEASQDSLTLSPWVQSRIRELGIHGNRDVAPVGVMVTKVMAARVWVKGIDHGKT